MQTQSAARVRARNVAGKRKLKAVKYTRNATMSVVKRGPKEWPAHRARADDDQVREDNGAVSDIKRSLLAIAQRQHESAQREEKDGRKYEQATRWAE
jgi:hypothetical protein